MELFNGDSVTIIPELINMGVLVDLTITSPPYDKLKKYNDTLVWNEDVWKDIITNLYKITKDGGMVVWITNDATIKGNETGTSFKQALYFQSVGFNLHDTMIWNKPNPFNFGSNKCYKQSFEYMFVFSKGRPKTLNLIKDVPAKMAGKVLKGARKHSDGTRDIVPDFVCSNYKKRTNVWNVNTSSVNNGHPAVFPQELARDHMLSWSNPGDIVFDPFMGSGTVGVVAQNEGRDFIGIEKVKDYYDISVSRVGSSNKSLVLSGGKL